MKFTVDKKVIQNVLSKIQGITNRRTSLLITGTVLIKSTDTGIMLSATDLETGFEGFYDAVIESKGAIVLNAKRLYDITKDFPSDKIIFNEQDNHWVEISNQKVVYKIVGMSPKDFPITPKIKDAAFFEIDSKILKRMIEKMLVISGTLEDSRAHISGVSFERIINKKEKLIRMASTDSSRLSKVDYIYNQDFNLPKGSNIIIPKKGLHEVIKFLGAEENVQISSEDSYFIVKKDTETIIIGLLEGEFPEYEKIIVRPECDAITMNKYSFLMALKRMSILSSEEYKSAVFNFEKNKLTLTVTNPEIGESKEDIDIEYEGKSIETAFNPKYFIEILNVIDDNEIIIYLTDEESPCLIEGKTDKNFLNIIMPMKI